MSSRSYGTVESCYLERKGRSFPGRGRHFDRILMAFVLSSAPRSMWLARGCAAMDAACPSPTVRSLFMLS